jgi:predicted dehydrogenase
MDTVRWGILGTAKIGVEKVIPAIQQASNAMVKSIASRTSSKAKKTARQLGIPDFHGSYTALLADPSVDAVYNPLPNHLHVPQTIEALKAGKHVLCEKPIALDSSEAKILHTAIRDFPDLKVMEAFMYRFHPQWRRAKSMIDEGKIGMLQTVESFFSYYNDDPNNIRNNPEMGGGALMDIGCYCISLSRYLYGHEPENVSGTWKIDTNFGIDYLSSGLLDFGSGTATFTCATQAAPYQKVNIIGTKGRIVIDMPFNAPVEKETTMWYYPTGKKHKKLSFDPTNQYILQIEEFSYAILENTAVPIPFQDALNNMKAIDTFRKNARTAKKAKGQ